MGMSQGMHVDAAVFVYVCGSWNSSWVRLTCSSFRRRSSQPISWLVQNTQPSLGLY